MVFLGCPHFGPFLTLYILLGNYIQCPSFHPISHSWISDPLINCILNITTQLFCIQYVYIFLLNNHFLLNLLSWLSIHPVVWARWLVIYDSWPVFKSVSWACLLHKTVPFCCKYQFACVTCYGVRSYSTYVCIITAWYSCSNIIDPQ